MNNVEIRNAVIESAIIDDADHGILTASLKLNYGGSVQCFGGYNLYSPANGANERNYAGLFLWRTMEVVGVSSWDALHGKTVRVKIIDGRAAILGHIIKDSWFGPKAEFEALKGAKQ